MGFCNCMVSSGERRRERSYWCPFPHLSSASSHPFPSFPFTWEQHIDALHGLHLPCASWLFHHRKTRVRCYCTPIINYCTTFFSGTTINDWCRWHESVSLRHESLAAPVRSMMSNLKLGLGFHVSAVGESRWKTWTVERYRSRTKAGLKHMCVLSIEIERSCRDCVLHPMKYIRVLFPSVLC